MAVAGALSQSPSIDQIDALADKLMSSDNSEEHSRLYQVFCKYHPDGYDLLLPTGCSADALQEPVQYI